MFSSKPSFKQIYRLLMIGVCLFVLAAHANAQLSRSQARNLVRRMAGFDLPGSAVRVRSVTETGTGSAEIKADIRAVFRFRKVETGMWRIAEVRTGQDRWEQVSLIAKAAGALTQLNACTTPDPPLRGSIATDPSNKRARCLLGAMFGIDVPSDAIRIQQISPLAIPFSSEPSALVVAWIAFDARAGKGQGGWHISELRTGNRAWVDLEKITATLTQEKQLQTRVQLEAMSIALENYRKDRGSYIVSDNHGVLMDHISPTYLIPVVRLDPWNQPYKYQGTRDHFTITSGGPDGKTNTADDITLSR